MYPGTDIIEIKRISRALEKYPQLKTRLFTEAEITECETRGNPAMSFAGRFAAKEAILKALGTGLRGLKWVDIEVVSNCLGQPEVHLSGPALELAVSLNIYDVRVSISHTREMAIAFAMALTGEEKSESSNSQPDGEN